MDGMEPEKKRARLLQDEDDKRMNLLRHPEAVLADEYTDTLNLVKAVSCTICDKRETCQISKELQTHIPLRDLAHLRRVKPGEDKESLLRILVFPLRDIVASCDDVTEVSSEVVFSHLVKLGVSTAVLGDPRVERVCARQPTTRRQFTAARLHWPTAFHENKEITKMINKQKFSEAQLCKHECYMRQAIDQAKQAGMEGEAVGSVLVDPASGTVVAAGHDRRKMHPLQHATMVAVDLVARAQGAGAWDLTGSSLTCGQVVCREDGTGPYLCTGYDLYVTREPCSMCAMALVHSRVRTVFYGSACRQGALGSTLKVHTEPGLNHHYDVYRHLLHAPCGDLLNYTDAPHGTAPMPGDDSGVNIVRSNIHPIKFIATCCAPPVANS